MAISFDNTQVAFSSRSDKDLKGSYWLFRLISNPALVSIGKVLTNIALAIRFPIKWIVKPTIFRQFCGGETVEESRKKINDLARFNIKSVLDYSAEGKESEEDFDRCTEECISIINEAKHNRNIGFSVFKPTGIARFELLEKVSAIGIVLTEIEKKEFDRVHERFNRICKASYDTGVPVFVDAEESWIQRAVDGLINEMMKLYNKEKAIVYNTFQLYRTDRLEYLIDCFLHAKNGNYFLGAKLVRGAYLEKERERALKMNYKSPINDTKELTDSMYDGAIRFCMAHLDRISFCCASHNEKSSMLAVELMKEKNLFANHPNIYFSQLLGMSDTISYNLALAGYNVSKYVPYGPVRDVIPYLIRRAQENTSVKGQTGRELGLILKERERRKN
ncbi:MAG: proline dehydrogenase family protein [Bacteroidetes bacterium]|nr:proline dehydrogenase family protein [Bacteroidota bacterium]